jgi:uncharacterized protein YcnI
MTGHRRTPRRLAALAVCAAVAGPLLPGPAWADVALDPSTAPQGGFVGLTFRVTNESRTAAMTQVEVYLPDDTPIAEVYPYSVPDWTPKLTTGQVQPPTGGDRTFEVVSAITWTAASGKAVKPGGVAELSVSLSPLPTKDRLAFTVVQTYSDGTVERSSDEPGPDGRQPDHQAPVLQLVPVEAPNQPTAVAEPEGSTDPASGDGNSLTIALSAGITGLLLGLLIGYGIAEARRHRTTVAVRSAEAPVPGPAGEPTAAAGHDAATAHGTTTGPV